MKPCASLNGTCALFRHPRGFGAVGWGRLGGKAVADAHQAKLVADKHEGVPPVGAFVTVAKLESADGARRQEFASLGERDSRGVWNVSARGELRNDLGDLGAEFDVAKELIHLRGIQQGHVKVGQLDGRRIVGGRWEGRFRIHAAAGGGGGEVKRGILRRGRTRTALVGAGQTSWQTPQPVQASATTIGMPFSTFIAFGTGQRSTQTVQKEV